MNSSDVIKLLPENLLFTKSFLYIRTAVESLDKKVAAWVEGNDCMKQTFVLGCEGCM